MLGKLSDAAHADGVIDVGKRSPHLLEEAVQIVPLDLGYHLFFSRRRVLEEIGLESIQPVADPVQPEGQEAVKCERCDVISRNLLALHLMALLMSCKGVDTAAFAAWSDIDVFAWPELLAKVLQRIEAGFTIIHLEKLQGRA